jgi:heme oxygenase (biliverdin-IX-beta and delta-forming)
MGRHMRLEKRLPLMAADFTQDRYRELLRRFFGYYSPLEERLAGFHGMVEAGFDYEGRRKTPKLVRDLLALSDSSETLITIPRCETLPALETPGQVWGCLYVIEGSTLGGQIISAHLKGKFGLTPDAGSAFFSGYGKETGQRWIEFKTALTTASERGDMDDEIVASASATFDTLGEWVAPETEIKQ